MATQLEFINKTDITDGVVTVNVDNVFSSQYEIYQIIFDGVFHNLDVSNGIEGIRFIDNSGSVISGSEYEYAVHNLIANSSYTETRSTSATEIQLVLIADQLSDGQANGVLTVYNPNDSSSYTFTNFQGMGKNSSQARGQKAVGVHKNAETIRGFQLVETNSGRPFGGGSIITYGVK
tara:strand:- start:794 stop:1324 length:531 start_codon:yes stop_codon:yes gene_type:complete